MVAICILRANCDNTHIAIISIRMPNKSRVRQCSRFCWNSFKFLPFTVTKLLPIVLEWFSTRRVQYIVNVIAIDNCRMAEMTVKSSVTTWFDRGHTIFPPVLTVALMLLCCVRLCMSSVCRLWHMYCDQAVRPRAKHYYWLLTAYRKSYVRNRLVVWY